MSDYVIVVKTINFGVLDRCQEYATLCKKCMCSIFKPLVR